MPVIINPDHIYRINELSDILKCSKFTIYKRIKQNKIKANKLLGKDYLIKGSDILKAMESWND